MADYLGDVVAGATVRGVFNTRDSSGAPVTLDSGAIRVYKDDGTTEDDSGITLNTDFDSKTGLHLWEIDTSADGTFYSAGSDFFVFLSAGTADSVSVIGVCVGHFSLENRNRNANVTHFGGNAGTFASGIPAVNTTLIEGSDATNQIRDAVVDDATRIDASALNTASAAVGSDGSGLTEAGGTGDHLTALASASALATVDNNVDAILADTGTDGVVVASGSKSGYSLAADQSGVTVGTVNALGAQAKADVNAEADQALADYDAPTKAELDAAVAPLATATALQTVDDEIATIDSNVDAIKAKTDNLPSDPADQSAVEAAIDAAESAILSAIGDVPTNAELTSALAAADDAVLSAIAALNNLSSAGAQAAAAAALTAYGAALEATVGAVRTDTEDIQSRLPAALSSNGNMKADIREVNNVEVGGAGTEANPWGPAS